jgi:hypothetical protein
MQEMMQRVDRNGSSAFKFWKQMKGDHFIPGKQYVKYLAVSIIEHSREQHTWHNVQLLDFPCGQYDR